LKGKGLLPTGNLGGAYLSWERHLEKEHPTPTLWQGLPSPKEKGEASFYGGGEGRLNSLPLERTALQKKGKERKVVLTDKRGEGSRRKPKGALSHKYIKNTTRE